jgi:hypothetical protein
MVENEANATIVGVRRCANITDNEANADHVVGHQSANMAEDEAIATIVADRRCANMADNVVNVPNTHVVTSRRPASASRSVGQLSDVPRVSQPRTCVRTVGRGR